MHVKEFEKQIDQMVYKLYDLTPEEIKIVERENVNADWAGKNPGRWIIVRIKGVKVYTFHNERKK